LIPVRNVQGVRGLRHDQQCFRWKRVVPDLLQLRDDFVLAGDMLPGECDGSFGLRQMAAE
jgi:hypothetical protein